MTEQTYVSVQTDPSKKSRREDAAIAWTWKTFIENTSDPEILHRLPMTKVHRLSSQIFQQHQLQCSHSDWYKYICDES